MAIAREVSRDWAALLIAEGQRYLDDIGPMLDAADPFGLVERRSRLLCAGLGAIARLTYDALGGTSRAGDVGRAGALLSLVTKVDDQVIDGPAFHGAGRRAQLAGRVRDYLAPTLRSIHLASPADGEARCAMAARFGASATELSASPPRLGRLLTVVDAGWAIQVDAVEVFSSAPGDVSRARVARTTGAISGVWLLMIALVGTLPGDARRALTADEERAFFAWGNAIQRADALADLEKDVRDGLIATLPGRLLFERAGGAYADARRRGDAREIYRLLREHGVDAACEATPRELAALRARMEDLGEVGALLEWVYGFLLGRYYAHPLFARDVRPIEATCSAR